MQANRTIDVNPIPVVVPGVMRFTFTRSPGCKLKVRTRCHHSLPKRELVMVGAIVISERQHWRGPKMPAPPQYCTRCSVFGRRHAKAILCAIDKTHVIFPGSRVGRSSTVDSILEPYATRISGTDQYVCCANCAGRGVHLIGTWNGSSIIP